MSGYADMLRDEEQAKWLAKWVPADDKMLEDCPVKFREQYRFTLARARAAEDEVKVLRNGLGAFRGLLQRTDR